MTSPKEKNNVEIGETQNEMHPVTLESPQIMWAFIRKVYSIIAIQLILIIIVGSVVIFVPSVKHFIIGIQQTRSGTAFFILLNIFPLGVLLLLILCHRKHPFNILLLILLTLALAFGVGSACALSRGKIILQTAILVAVVVVSLILYTFCAAKKGYNFQFLRPFLFATCFLMIAFFIIQMLCPWDQEIRTIIGLAFGLVFCAYVVHDTDNLINGLSKDEYIWGSARLHLDIVPIFISFVTCHKLGYCLAKS